MALAQVLLSFCLVAFVAAASTHRSKKDFALKVEPRIIGGAEIKNRCSAPYNSMVALQFDNLVTGPVTFCSAVMLTESILVTSGQCIYQISNINNPYIAAVGERDLMMTDEDEQKIGVRDIKIHYRYNYTSGDNNIALLQLESPANLGRCVQPANTMEDDPTACTDLDRSCIMAGWGPYAETSMPTNSRIPRSASLTVYGELVTSLLARSLYTFDVPEGTLFADATNPNQKACFFDWGGFVSCMRNGKYVLRGLIGDHNCFTDVSPPIYVTDVPYFQSWIDTCLADWESCQSL